jgi:GNAT superfamily N-acetyltransferase
MIDFSVRILILSSIIALATGLPVYLSVHVLLVRPMRRIASRTNALREQAEDSAYTMAALRHVCDDMQGVVWSHIPRCDLGRPCLSPVRERSDSFGMPDARTAVSVASTRRHSWFCRHVRTRTASGNGGMQMSAFESSANGGMGSEIRRGASPAPIRIDVSRLRAHHVAEFSQLLLTLDQPSRVYRFGQAASDAALISHASQAVTSSTWIAGAFVERQLRGVVEVYDASAAGFAEAAFVVEQGWRRRGIGFMLLATATRWAAQSNVPMLRMVFSRANWPMRKLADKANARFDVIFDEMTADVCIRRSPATTG